jgi:hypothetical protein
MLTIRRTSLLLLGLVGAACTESSRPSTSHRDASAGPVDYPPQSDQRAADVSTGRDVVTNTPDSLTWPPVDTAVNEPTVAPDAVVADLAQLDYGGERTTDGTRDSTPQPIADTANAVEASAMDGRAPEAQPLADAIDRPGALEAGPIADAGTVADQAGANDPPPTARVTISKGGTGAGTVTSLPAGIDCGPTCAADFPTGTVVTLTATADAASTFAGWSGACSGTGSCLVTVNAAQTVTASFSVAQAGLTVAKSGSGGGTITSSPAGIACGSTCSASFTAGAVVTLTAIPDASSTFVGWSGACSGSAACTVTVGAATSVTASFDLVQYTLTVSKTGTGSGTVTSSVGGIACSGTCSASFASGTVLSLTATPATGSSFAGWSGACTGTGSCALSMTAARSVSASFVAGVWSPGATPGTARAWHTATTFPSGRILVAGGSSTSVLSSAEIYDPSASTFSGTGSMTGPRRSHTATLLANGKVLIVGGQSTTSGSSPLATADLYDPATGQFTATGSLAIGRYSHSATLLPSGKVLVTGGICYSVSVLQYTCISAELYDPDTGLFTSTASMGTRRDQHAAILLSSGKVLVAGGYQRCCQGVTTSQPLTSAELYDPSSGTWTATGPLAAARYNVSATLLPSGAVLVVGGSNGSSDLASAELFDPTSGNFVAVGSLAHARGYHTATLLTSGKVLVAAGYDVGTYLTSAELFDPTSATFSPTTPLASRRALHTATLLASGKVLVVGGYDGSTLASSEVYDPGT